MKMWKISFVVTLILATSGVLFANGLAGNALQFDGLDDFAFVADNPTLDLTGPMTLETWVQIYTRDPSHEKYAVGKQYAYYIYCENYAYGGTGNWKGQVWAPGHTDVYGTTNLQEGQWYHLALTYDLQNIRVFLNGQLEGTRSNTSPINTGHDYNLSFGNEMSHMSYPLHGLLDEVRLWDVARTPEEILANYNRTVDSNSAGLVGYWNFDEAPGMQSILDVSNHGNDGLLGATAAVASDDPLRVVSDAPLIMDIVIDIRPGCEQNPVNLRSNGVLPVGVFGEEGFDVYDIDLSTLVLDGATPKQQGDSGELGSFRDLNGDNLTDLLLHFEMSELDVDGGATELSLEGLLSDGTALAGSDVIRIVPPGDANADGLVNGADLSTIITYWGQSVPSGESGDLDGNGIVGGPDYSEVLSYWGTGTAPEPPGGVPEPATLGVLVLGGLVMLIRRRK